MSHVPLFAHGKAEDVLIVGGGDCGIAEEVLKHSTVKRLTQVEIDPAVIEFAKEHFPEFTKPVFADKRFESVIDDGAKYVARTNRRFDAIIVDSTDPIGPGKILFGSKFYAGCKRCMKPGGVLVTQNGVPFFQKTSLPPPWQSSAGYLRMRTVMSLPSRSMSAATWPWGSPVTTGNCGVHAVETIAQRYRTAGNFKTKYWTPEVHVAAFAQPRFIADLVAKGCEPKQAKTAGRRTPGFGVA